MLTVSVIIPSLNSPLIAQVLACLKRQILLPTEVLIVGRDEPGLLDRADPFITFVDTHTPVSPAVARNRGAQLARGDLLCFLDADCLPSPAWIVRLIAHHEHQREVVGGGVALPLNGYWGICDNLATFADVIDCTAAGERGHLPSLNFTIRRSLFLQMGGFDETFTRPAGEDTDLCFRLRRAGYRLWFEPAASVLHCPARQSFGAMWAHLYLFGVAYRSLRGDYNDVIGDSFRFRFYRTYPRLAMLLAPLLALLDSLGSYRRHPALRRYWYAPGGVVIARLAWHVGFIRGTRDTHTVRSED